MEEQFTQPVQQQPVQAPMQSKFSNFFHSIMSVDETRVSVLMIGFMLSLFFGGYMYLSTGALSQVWADIVETLIFAVAGINAVNSLVGGNNKLGQILRGATNNPPPPPMPPREERK